ncbi:MAG: thioesterase family protein [Planctomycetota bacterium]
MFKRRYRYRFGDIDHAGIAYYPALLHACHCAFEDFWADDLGVTYPSLMSEHNLGFPAVHLEADFLAQIRYGDEPEIAVGVLRVGRSSVDFGFWWTTGEPACHVRITTVAVAMDTLQKMALPERWRQEFTARLVTEPPFHGRGAGGSANLS